MFFNQQPKETSIPVLPKKPIFIANWKMNLASSESLELAQNLKQRLKDMPTEKEVVICPAFTSLFPVGEILKGTNLVLGAQDVFWETAGSFTGEISPVYLKDLGCQYVIVGHSERRQNLGETDEMINKKVLACLDNGLTPVLCVGENLSERQEGSTGNKILRQLTRALAGVDLVEQEKLVIAYEPVWAISPGPHATAEETGEVLSIIKQSLRDLFPLTIINNNIRLIYGGSMEADLLGDFSSQELVEGFLVGQASLSAEEFIKLVENYRI
ncbi:MAG: triose-phosphate isomerase [Patescibacteria group bacterium]